MTNCACSGWEKPINSRIVRTAAEALVALRSVGAGGYAPCKSADVWQCSETLGRRDVPPVVRHSHAISFTGRQSLWTGISKP